VVATFHGGRLTEREDRDSAVRGAGVVHRAVVSAMRATQESSNGFCSRMFALQRSTLAGIVLDRDEQEGKAKEINCEGRES
jgi:hypothetical protein